MLLPTTARDSIQSLLTFAVGDGKLGPKAVLILPLILVLAVPLYSFFLLVKDVVEFYFAPHFLAEDALQLTRFSLAGLTFPFDESPEFKARVLAWSLTDPAYVKFVLGGSEESRKAVSETFSKGVAFPLRARLDRKLIDARKTRITNVRDEDYQVLAAAMAGSLDMDLVGEVSRAEASLERHVLRLRRLVLRYVKSLLVFVWTGMAVMGGVSVLTMRGGYSDKMLCMLALGIFLGWSVTTAFVVQLPRVWIDILGFGGSFKGKFHWRKPANDSQMGQIQDHDINAFEIALLRVLAGSSLALVVALVYVGAWAW